MHLLNSNEGANTATYLCDIRLKVVLRGHNGRVSWGMWCIHVYNYIYIYNIIAVTQMQQSTYHSSAAVPPPDEE